VPSEADSVKIYKGLRGFFIMAQKRKKVSGAP
jgi:hypothetical protein